MKTVAILSQKGGAGKTTLAIHLAVASAQAGHNTAIIDLDPQASSTNWGARRVAPLPVVIPVHAARLRPELIRVKEGGGALVYLDTPPHTADAAFEAARISDLVVIPCRPAVLDLETLANSLEFLRTAKTPIAIVINAAAAVGRDADQATEALANLDVELAPTRLGHRVAFSRALIAGQVAQEFDPRGKAAEEIAQLHEWIQQHLNGGSVHG